MGVLSVIQKTDTDKKTDHIPHCLSMIRRKKSVNL